MIYAWSRAGAVVILDSGPWPTLEGWAREEGAWDLSHGARLPAIPDEVRRVLAQIIWEGRNGWPGRSRGYPARQMALTTLLQLPIERRHEVARLAIGFAVTRGITAKHIRQLCDLIEEAAPSIVPTQSQYW